MITTKWSKFLESNEDKLFWKITEPEYNQCVYGDNAPYLRVDLIKWAKEKWIEFTNKEKMQMFNLGLKLNNRLDSNHRKTHQLKSRETYYLFLTKMEDEWFYVSDKYGYWKCDQFDGLISCLKNNCEI